MKITLAALMMITLTQALASERPNVYPSSYSTLGPSRLESAVCSNAYLIKQPIEVINSKRQNKCADFTYFSPEHKACEDRVLKELGTLAAGVTLEMSANPTDAKAEDDFLKEMQSSYEHKFSSKPQMIEGNMKALELALKEVKE